MVDVRWLEGDSVKRGSVADVPRARESSSCVWVDVLGADEATLKNLAEYFPMHPLAIEDCLHFPQRPKLDSYDEAIFLVWLTPFGRLGDIEPRELDTFIGEDWVVTVHNEALAGLDAVVTGAAHYLHKGSDWLTHGMLDRLVDDVFPLIDDLGDRLDELQDEMLEHAEQSHLAELYDTRRDLLSLHKMVAPERDALRGLARERVFITEEAYRYFQDVADHLARVEDSIETYREVAASSVDIYLSAQSNRMNAIMKQLTIVATIFMPLTLITGVYGMNFSNQPELHWKYGYFGVLMVMLLIAGGMLAFFKRHDWW